MTEAQGKRRCNSATTMRCISWARGAVEVCYRFHRPGVVMWEVLPALLVLAACGSFNHLSTAVPLDTEDAPAAVEDSVAEGPTEDDTTVTDSDVWDTSSKALDSGTTTADSDEKPLDSDTDLVDTDSDAKGDTDTDAGACPPGETLWCGGGGCSNSAWLGDGECDVFFDCAATGWDGGDCATGGGGSGSGSCPLGETEWCSGFGCSTSAWIGDGDCDSFFDCAATGWDGGDCAP